MSLQTSDKNMYQYNSDGFRNNFDLDDIDLINVLVFGCNNRKV